MLLIKQHLQGEVEPHAGDVSCTVTRTYLASTNYLWGVLPRLLFTWSKGHGSKRHTKSTRRSGDDQGDQRKMKHANDYSIVSCVLVFIVTTFVTWPANARDITTLPIQLDKDDSSPTTVTPFEGLNVTNSTSDGKPQVIRVTVIAVFPKPSGMTDAKYKELIQKLKERQMTPQEQKSFWKRVVHWWNQFLNQIRNAARKLINIFRSQDAPTVSNPNVGLSENTFRRRTIPMEATNSSVSSVPSSTSSSSNPSSSPDESVNSLNGSVNGTLINGTWHNTNESSVYNVSQVEKEGHPSTKNVSDIHNYNISSGGTSDQGSVPNSSFSHSDKIPFSEKDIEENEVKEYSQGKDSSKKTPDWDHKVIAINED